MISILKFQKLDYDPSPALALHDSTAWQSLTLRQTVRTHGHAYTCMDATALSDGSLRPGHGQIAPPRATAKAAALLVASPSSLLATIRERLALQGGGHEAGE